MKAKELLFCFFFLPEVRISKTLQDIFWKPWSLHLKIFSSLANIVGKAAIFFFLSLKTPGVVTSKVY